MLSRGFSLLEMVIVLLILGLLFGISYPIYTEQITRTRRLDGQMALLNFASQMERHFAETQRYDDNTALNILGSEISPGKWYTLAIDTENTDSAHFRLLAIPRLRQASADILCQTLTLNSVGEKGIQGGTATAAELCW
ncbi:MAG: type IV pilin protein [Legionellaceae bacterium]|nr:type IV pilin protein [Legionellaceae bacterium]